MQVTELQVQRSLEALTGDGSDPDPARGQDLSPMPARGRSRESSGPPNEELSVNLSEDGATDLSQELSGGLLDGGADGLPQGLVQHLTETPPIRDHRVEEARRQLETDAPPTAEALAQRMVGRLVCDRLR